MKAETIKALYADFEKIDERKGLGGKTFKYLKPAPVIHRLNKVFNNRWSMRVANQVSMEDWVLVLVELTVPDDEDGSWITREAWGSKEIERFNSGPNKGKAIDPGNAYKSAMSDGLKKAASSLGIGLHQLYDLDENGVDFEGLEEVDLAEVSVEPTPEPTPVVEEPEPAPKPEPQPFDEPEKPAVPDPTPTADDESPQEITDVQRTAVEKMSELKNIPVKTLVEKALGKVQPLEKLTYQEGILVIREANKVKTPK